MGAPTGPAAPTDSQSRPELLVEDFAGNLAGGVIPLFPSEHIFLLVKFEFGHKCLQLVNQLHIFGIEQNVLFEIPLRDIFLGLREREHESVELVVLHAVGTELLLNLVLVPLLENQNVQQDCRIMNDKITVFNFLVVFLSLLPETEFQIHFRVKFRLGQLVEGEFGHNLFTQSFDSQFVKFRPHLPLVRIQPVRVNQDPTVQQLINCLLPLLYLLSVESTVLRKICLELPIKFRTLHFLHQLRVIQVVKQSQSTPAVGNDIVAFNVHRVKCVMIHDLHHLAWAYLSPKIVVIQHEALVFVVQILHHLCVQELMS